MRKYQIIFLAALVLLTISAGFYLTSNYNINWWFIGGGGGTLSGGNYIMDGNPAQAEVVASSRGGNYLLDGGFFANPGAGINLNLFLPQISR